MHFQSGRFKHVDGRIARVEVQMRPIEQPPIHLREIAKHQEQPDRNVGNIRQRNDEDRIVSRSLS